MNSNEQTKTEDNFDKHHCGRHGRCHGWGKFALIIPVIILVKSAVVMLLWNNLAPELFHLSTLDYWQAIELTVLAKLLVGFGGRHGGHFGGGRWGRWARMSPEEREKMRSEMRSRWGGKQV